jgi:septal ring factor EnvC (AmiA/AmiB activator)
LTPQEKADIFQAYQVRISRGKDEYTLQEKNKLDEAIQKLNEKSAKESERVYADTARASNKIKEILGI